MNYEQTAKEARLKVLDLIYKAQTSHIGSNFSAIDIMTVLFDKADPEKDEVVLSAGWKAAAWYYFLWRKGVITEEELNSFCQPESKFIGLVEPIENRWGLKIGGGSMGLGLPGAVGLAMAKKIKGEEGVVYVLMSDGELQCGTFWESSLIASQHKLDNLVVIVDRNEFQAMGLTKDILELPHPSRYDHLGWFSTFSDGHSYEELEYVLETGSPENCPLLITARTTKGRGVSFMENNNLYHYKQLSEEEYLKAKGELYGRTN